MKPFQQLKAFALVLMTLGFAACETSNNHAFSPPIGPEPTAMLLEVQGEQYVVDLSSTDTLNLRTLCAEFGPVEFKVLNAVDFKSISIYQKPVTDGVAEIDFYGNIPLDEQMTCVYTTANGGGSFLINTYPSKAPKYIKSGTSAEIPGDFYLSFIYQPLIMKVDNSGSLLYYRFEPTDYNGTFKELGCWDFKKHVFDDGKTYYSYHAPDWKFGENATTGYVPGMRILMDDHYNPIDTIHALASLDGYLPDGSPLDGHDFYFFSPTHWIASASYIKRDLLDGTRRAVAYLQEVDNGKVVFDWWSSRHPELKTMGSPEFDTDDDYVHFNSIDVLPDGNWLVSFRALSTIAVINHEDGSFNCKFKGDVRDSEESYVFFSGQHYVRYHEMDGKHYITLFNNGNATGTTSAVRLEVENVNTNSLNIKRVENLLDSSFPKYFTQACGALDYFGDQGFVMGWGWSTDPGNCTRLVSEFDRNGKEIFRLDRDDPDPMSVDPSYRCVKCP
jgi:hypothetical protein